MVDEQLIQTFLSAPEGEHLELKREWYDWKSKSGKAQLARDVLAMANTLREGETGYLVIGVSDDKHGHELVGVDETPSPEAIAEILYTYTSPVPRVQLHDAAYQGKQLSVLEVTWTESHPYFATRDIDGILSTDAVYIRRGPTVGRLKPPEFIDLVRQKEARLGPSVRAEPLMVGFVEIPLSGSNAELTLRVTNVTEEPIDNVMAVVDTRLVFYPHAVRRQGLIANAVLGPGESREFPVRPGQASFYAPDGRPLNTAGKIWDRWLDVRVSLTYRDRDGFVQRIVREISLD